MISVLHSSYGELHFTIPVHEVTDWLNKNISELNGTTFSAFFASNMCTDISEVTLVDLFE